MFPSDSDEFSSIVSHFVVLLYALLEIPELELVIIINKVHFNAPPHHF